MRNKISQSLYTRLHKFNHPISKVQGDPQYLVWGFDYNIKNCKNSQNFETFLSSTELVFRRDFLLIIGIGCAKGIIKRYPRRRARPYPFHTVIRAVLLHLNTKNHENWKWQFLKTKMILIEISIGIWKSKK